MMLSLTNRSFLVTGALSLMVMTLFVNKCSANPIRGDNTPLPSPRRIVEIAGMAAYYREREATRKTGVVVNEYEYDRSASVFPFILGEARLGNRDRHIVRQSVCFDVRLDESSDTVRLLNLDLFILL